MTKYIPDLSVIGQKYGLLTIKSFAGLVNVGRRGKRLAQYECVCDCGNTVIVKLNSLKSGNKKQCCKESHKKFKFDKSCMTGKKNGSLTVVAFDKVEKDSRGKVLDYWICKCDCGIEKSLHRNRFLNTQSCGCLLQNMYSERSRQLVGIGISGNALEPGQAATNAYYNDYKRSAKLRKICFDISLDKFVILIEDKCKYCQTQPYRKYPSSGRLNSRSYNGGIIVNGIDRIDSNIGYTIDNCVSCCQRCNYAKNKIPLGEFIEWMEQIRTLSKKHVSNLKKLKT